MKSIAKMTQEEKLEAINTLQMFIESAVESEQDEPADFKLETQKRIDLVLINLKELMGLTDIS
jgi:hypothetical protein